MYRMDKLFKPPPPLWRKVKRKRNFINILFQLNDLVWKDKCDIGRWLFDRTKMNVKFWLSGFICIVLVVLKEKPRTVVFVLLVNNKPDAQLFFICVYSNPLHVSSNRVLIIGRVNCINTTTGICHCM